MLFNKKNNELEDIRTRYKNLNNYLNKKCLEAQISGNIKQFNKYKNLIEKLPDKIIEWYLKTKVKRD